LFLSGGSEQSSDQAPINPHLRAVWAAVSAETSSVSVSEKSIASANRPKCLFKIRAPLPPGDRIEA
jgi:hypothetical protein